MEKKIVVGKDIFDKFIRDGGYYVDKTELIYDLVAGTGNEVSLFTRPRRFGKTLTMSMMESFFDIRRNSADVFDGTNILVNHPDFCREWMNQYPVLFLSFKDVEGRDFPSAYGMLKNRISAKCAEFMELAENAYVTQRDDKVKVEGYEHQLIYGIAFFGKKAKVKCG